jgi:hypothetical protein
LIYRHTALARATYSINFVFLAIARAARQSVIGANRTAGHVRRSDQQGVTLDVGWPW